MGRSPCCSKEELTKGAWTVMEDQILTEYIRTHGEGKWRKIPKEAGLKRCGKSCRLRWLNYLRPDIKRGNITLEEEDLIIRLHKLLGNRWSLIAGRIPGRTDNEIKNYWNTTLGKKVNNAADIHQPTNENSSCKKNKKILDEKVKNKTKTNIAVRTKALRWKNKVVVSPQVPFQVDQNHGFVSASAKSSDFDKKDQDLAKYTPELEENSSEDVMLDFDVREFLMSGISPDSDFWKICQFDGDNNNGGASKNKWPSSAAPLLFSEEVLKDWMRDDCYFHHQN